MFKEMRRIDRKINNEEVIEILKNGEYGILSIVGKDGYAYGVPLSYTYMDKNIYFHCAVEGYKLDSIKENNNVSFCVVGKTQPIPEKFSTTYESAIVFGKAIEVYEEEKYNALLSIIEKYSNEYMEQGKAYVKNAGDKTKVLKICIENITGKARR